MTTNDSISFIAAELQKDKKSIANFKDGSDKALLSRTMKLANDHNLSFNGQASSSILTDINAMETILRTNPVDPAEQELKKYLTTSSTVTENDVLVSSQIATDAAAQAEIAQKVADDAAKLAKSDPSSANTKKATDAAEQGTRAAKIARSAKLQADTIAKQKR